MEIVDSHSSVNNVARYCAGAGCGPLGALLAWYRGGRGLPVWEQFSGRWSIGTHLGRVGIAWLPSVWDLRPGDEVLVPAYNCGSELDPLIHAGLTVVLYRVDRHACIDIQDLQRRAGVRTRAVYVTHYFGWAQDLSTLRAWCRERGLFLIEDCALSLFSAGPRGPLGVEGDAAIFSLRKSLPVPDGGILTLREAPRREPPPQRRPAALTTGRAMLPLFKSRLLRAADRLGLYHRFRPERAASGVPMHCGSGQAVALPDMPADYYYRRACASWDMSRVTAGLLQAVDPRLVRDRRRANYDCLRDALAGLSGLELLFPDLPAGVCPLVMPILVPDGRDRLVAALNRRGIGAFPFWAGYHRRLSWVAFPDARYLKDHLLTLPVDHALGRNHMLYIARTLGRLLPTEQRGALTNRAWRPALVPTTAVTAS